MFALLLAATISFPAPDAAAQPKPQPAESGKAMDADCPMECCKGEKRMPCCDKMKKADAPAPEGHGEHEHAH